MTIDWVEESAMWGRLPVRRTCRYDRPAGAGRLRKSQPPDPAGEYEPEECRCASSPSHRSSASATRRT
ncbi:hypothetical protein GCM10027605_51890 [Micromonospora zhanjiangensis]